MTKAELIAAVAVETNLTKVVTASVVDTLLSAITKTLKKEGRFAFTGLGVFEVVKRAKRQARNPRTNEPVVVKAHKAVKFRAAKSLKDSVK
jgi:DNA-binding protein HU-beta